jgi:hypothetical protein
LFPVSIEPFAIIVGGQFFQKLKYNRNVHININPYFCQIYG